uniref:Uncharacterized protein n=1 Tax=Ditylenchus dipsaci TaxID=166011 RepID=A0A915EI21_9BILA
MLMNPRYGGKKVERVENMDDRELLEYVVDQLTATLLSKTEGCRKGFSSLTRLVECFQIDTGLYPHEVAMRLGFSNFEVFIKSSEMKKYITISLLPDGRTFFSAKLKEDWDNGPLAPVLDRQTRTESVASRRVQEEHETFARAMLEENQGRLMEGRMQLAEIVYLCGGQENNVSLQELRDGYAKKYKMELTKKNPGKLCCFTGPTEKPSSFYEYRISTGRRLPIRKPKQQTFGERRVLNIAPLNPDIFGDDELNVESVFGSTSTIWNVNNADKFDLVDWRARSKGNEEFPDLWQDLEETESEDDAKLDQENYDDPILVDVSSEPLIPVLADISNPNSNHHNQTNQAESNHCSQKPMPQVTQPSTKSSIPIDFWKDEVNRVNQVKSKGVESPVQAQLSSSSDAVFLDQNQQDKPKKPVEMKSSQMYQPIPFRALGLDEGPEVVLDSDFQERTIHMDPDNLSKNVQKQQPVGSMSINPAEFMPQKVEDQRVDNLIQLIEALVLYRSITKQTTKLDLLVKALQKINHGYEIVMGPQDVLKFVKEHCKGLKIFYHDGEPVFCCITYYSGSNSQVQPRKYC